MPCLYTTVDLHSMSPWRWKFREQMNQPILSTTFAGLAFVLSTLVSASLSLTRSKLDLKENVERHSCQTCKWHAESVGSAVPHHKIHVFLASDRLLLTITMHQAFPKQKLMLE